MIAPELGGDRVARLSGWAQGLATVVVLVGCSRHGLIRPREVDTGGWTTGSSTRDAAGPGDAGGSTKTDGDGANTDAGGGKTDATGTKTDALGAKTDAAGAKTDAAGAKSDAAGAKTDAATGADHAGPLGYLGAFCTQGSECQSGFCAEETCCNAACDGLCVSCLLPGSAGTCSPVPAGQDPLEVCPDEGATSCGHDGFCDGRGSCRFYSSGVSCAPPGCSGDLWIPARTCDGAGTCTPGVGLSCVPFSCDPQTALCHTFCSGPGDCALGQTCSKSGLCGGYTGVGPCVSDAECLTGFCAQGVCCASKCDGPCASCALPGSLGTCRLVAPSNLPDGSVCPL